MLPDNLDEFPITPKRDVPAVPEQEQPASSFEGEASDWPSLIDLFMVSGVRVVAEEATPGISVQ